MGMSQLIRSRKAVITALRSIPPPPTSATTTSATTSLASSVALPISTKYGHRRPRTPNTTSASTTDASGSQQGKVK
ncbi:hypothetical protein DVH24_001191 [Malus domestica]|uniref:Uncharacterized protein n=1 Tax=Malus domestica TaxID=3750 RepID=A0A498K0P7_MALDO|nr:hypothetical protein DVH24_001191 [Malus domestica]